jgi:predicted class III extradiol MEMO1 family dioxygenase
VHYAQSSAARTESDSSVSYAAAVATGETRG